MKVVLNLERRKNLKIKIRFIFMKCYYIENIPVYIANDIDKNLNIFNINEYDLKVFKTKNIKIGEGIPNSKLVKVKNFVIYDYINNSDRVIIIKNKKVIAIKYFLELQNKDIGDGVYDIFGHKIKIKTASDIVKIKADFSLVNQLILEYQLANNQKSIFDIKNKYIFKWYNN